MTIDTINISTFGLAILNLEGYYDLPARKKILSDAGTEAKDIRFEGKAATVTLLGRFTSTADLVSKLNAFETLLKTSLKHAIVLIGHGLSFTGVFATGFEVTSFNGGKIVKITLPITITES